MQQTSEALREGFKAKGPGYWSFEFGDGYELCFEPLLWNDQMYVALYKDKDLLTNKVVVKPGYVKEEPPDVRA